MSTKNRRKLLKAIAAGSGAIVAGKNLPESWRRPVVESVMLPAHAATSLITCSPDPQEVTSNEASTDPPHEDAIAIVFNGSSCSLVIGDTPSDVGCTNVAFMADSDPGQTTWTSYDVSCGIWTQSNATFGGGANSSGTYEVDISGTPGQFRTRFTVTVTNGSAPTIRISDVTITPIT